MFALTEAPLDVAALRRMLDDPAAGAVACFEGVVRNHHGGRAVLRLAYQVYADLAQREGERIVREVRERLAVTHLVCVHRVGALEIGEVAVWVGASAAHRDAAFAAAREVIDAVKRDVPIWKKEFYADGESAWLHP